MKKTIGYKHIVWAPCRYMATFMHLPYLHQATHTKILAKFSNTKKLKENACNPPKIQKNPSTIPLIWNLEYPTINPQMIPPVGYL